MSAPLGEARRAEILIVLAVGLAWLYLFPRHTLTNNPNENVRVYLTKALVEHGTYAIGERRQVRPGAFVDEGSVTAEWGYVNDRSLACADRNLLPPECEGPLYSAKAPGTSWVGVPFYWAQKHLWRALDRPLTKENVIAWQRLFVMILPALIFLVAFLRFLVRRTGDLAVAFFATWFLGVATMLPTYTLMVASHVHAGILIFAGHALASEATDHPRGRPARLFWAGFALGWALLSEYPALLGGLAVGWLLLLRLPDRRDLVWFVLGGIPPLLLLLHYHQACFGAPWLTGQRWIEPEVFRQAIAPGMMGLTLPSWGKFVGSFWSPINGLFYFSPLLVAALPAVAVGLGARDTRRDVMGPALIGLAFLLFFSSHSLWRGGWTVGPRYLVPLEPFLVLLLAFVTARTSPGRHPAWRGALAGLALVSLWNRSLAHLTSQGFPFEFRNPLYDFALPLVREGYVFRSWVTPLGVHGVASVVPWAGLLVTGAAAAILGLAPRTGRARVVFAAMALALALGVGAGQASLTHPLDDKRADTLAWFRRVWDPPQQGWPGREAARVRAIPARERGRADWVDWTNAQTLLGRPRRLPAGAAAAFLPEREEPLEERAREGTSFPPVERDVSGPDAREEDAAGAGPIERAPAPGSPAHSPR